MDLRACVRDKRRFHSPATFTMHARAQCQASVKFIDAIVLHWPASSNWSQILRRGDLHRKYHPLCRRPAVDDALLMPLFSLSTYASFWPSYASFVRCQHVYVYHRVTSTYASFFCCQYFHACPCLNTCTDAPPFFVPKKGGRRGTYKQPLKRQQRPKRCRCLWADRRRA